MCYDCQRWDRSVSGLCRQLAAVQAENARLVRQLVRWHSQLRTAVFVGCVGMNPDKTIRAVVAEMGRDKSAMGSTCGAAEAVEAAQEPKP